MMERHEILEAMGELKLYGMRASFDEVTGKGLVRRDELYPLIASLIRAERTHRQARSISYRLSGAGRARAGPASGGSGARACDGRGRRNRDVVAAVREDGHWA